MRYKAVRAACALAIVVVGAVGCGGSDGDSETETTAGATKGGDGMVIGLSLPQEADPLIQLARDAFIQQSESYGNEVIVVDANADPSKQVADVQSLVERDVDAIAVYPAAPEAMQTAFDAARSADIPLIARQTTTGGPYFTNIQGDQDEAATALADVLADELGSGAKIAVIAGPPVAEAFRDRDAGFVNQAKERGLDVVDVQNNLTVRPDVSGGFTRTWKERFGSELKGMYDTLSTLALADVSAFSDGFDPLLVTRGGTDQDVAAVRDGRFFAIMYEDPILVGKAQAWAANIAARKLRKLPPDLHYETPVLDQANVDTAVPTATSLAKQIEFEVEDVDGRPTLREVKR